MTAERRCPFSGTGGSSAVIGQPALDRSEPAQRWLRRSVGCMPGRHEAARGRYQVVQIGTGAEHEQIRAAFEQFRSGIQGWKVTGCLYVLEDQRLARMPGREANAELASMFCQLSGAAPSALLSGSALRIGIETRCPATGQEAVYPDFDAFTFIPQAFDPEDDQYDPSNAAPWVCVNQNSDLFSFAMLLRDASLKKHGQELWTLGSAQRTQLIQVASERWQQLVMQTFAQYRKIGDMERCPTWVSNDQSRWYAHHEDTAFAADDNRLHEHEMPSMYLPRITQMWEAHFQDPGSVVLDYSGVTRRGRPLGPHRSEPSEPETAPDQDFRQEPSEQEHALHAAGRVC